MPKDRIARLNSLISQASDHMTNALGKLDQEVLENLDKLSLQEKIDFYTWLSKFQSERLNSISTLLPGASNGREKA